MRFPLLYLVIISIISSCYSPRKVQSSLNDNCDNNSHFYYPKTEKFYTTINVFTKHYSGIVIVKHFSSDSIYISFVSEIGFKYFEFQVIKNQFQTLYGFGKLKSTKAEIVIIDNLRLLLFISKIKPRIIPNRSMPQYCILIQKEIVLDATHKILFSTTNTCLYANKIWLINKSRKRIHGELRNEDQLIFTKHQILPIGFKFKSID